MGYLRQSAKRTPHLYTYEPPFQNPWIRHLNAPAFQRFHFTEPAFCQVLVGCILYKRFINIEIVLAVPEYLATHRRTAPHVT